MDTESNAKKVTVGLSGGVDSAVAALLLKEQGYDVTGVFMKNWDNSDPICPAEADYEDVRKTCETLDIPYYSVNFEAEYKQRVFDLFLDSLKAGFTPNPDVLCNREIKFAAFLDFALLSGADLLATGHYVRKKTTGDVSYLLKGADASKDQSYFLCLLRQDQIRNVLFPLGDLQKSDVRDIARSAQLAVAEKKDSTGICFIGERNFKNFLMGYLKNEPGEIRTPDGRVVGEHDGLPLYTLGQRRGLRIGGKHGEGEGRWFVIERDFAHNVLVVDHSEEALYTRDLVMDGVNFISGCPSDAFTCSAKVRYRQPDQAAFAKNLEDGTWHVHFEQPQRAVAPGQYCVLYDGDICIGGGRIIRAQASTFPLI